VNKIIKINYQEGAIMKVKDLVLDEIKDMSVSEYLSVYQYIHAIKAIRPKPSNKKREHAFEEVCSALSSLTGNLSDDIILARDDRV
jgi:hypothetical protein